MTKPLDFQSMTLALLQFWADRGCLIWQPYYTQVGAGTMNPATFLRVLGPEPWNVVYVEPSVRPDDGRYGENPNRMVQHYQLQVILKPDPGNPQEIYLDSLKSIGIDPRRHDLRFVEDNWESPALGAWGLGWEVWLDGQEITQFTYFQQAGGLNLNPVSVEITYGLDRIAIALQRARGFQEIRWNTVREGSPLHQPSLTAGDLNLQAEKEHSRYYFDTADIDRLRQMYDLYEIECRDALAQGLVLPAYDYLLKCSHTFNVLDTRGAIGVTERQAYFGRMRDLARKISDAYLEQRQRMEFPWLDEAGTRERGIQGAREAGSRAEEERHSRVPQPRDTPADFLLEIGTEELPVADLESALEQLRDRVPLLLSDLRLAHGEVHIKGTPRRLVVFVEDLAPRQPDQETMVKGPPASQAFNAAGEPTPAAEGFARSKAVRVQDLEVREINGGKYAVAFVREAGSPAGEVLARNLPDLIRSLRFEKPMRWNNSNVAFSRPIRWILALLGDQVVPFEYAGLQSGDYTRGLRFQLPEHLQVVRAEDYFAAMQDQGILVELDRRKERISEQVASLAAEVGGQAASDPALLLEVADLVEAPDGVRGSFDPDHLALPREVLISVMKKHQRYFPVEREGALLPYFIAITNGKKDGKDLVIEGNEHVLRARFADAAFFFNEDQKQPLEAYLPRLATLTFQAELGTMLDKTNRLHELVQDLAMQLGFDAETTVVARRAAQLCKADLVTRMVIEMTSLQGVMGRYYALHSGEPEPVATAILEHYLPRTAGDQAPKTLAGLAVGLADRLDTLVGLFAAGLVPSGARDPFGLRRAALGIVGNLIEWDLDFDLRAGLAAAGRHLPIPLTADGVEACLNFIIERLRNYLLERGYRYDVVDAILAAQGANPARAVRGVKALTMWVARADWGSILPAYARCVRITRDQAERFAVDVDLFVEPMEKDLYESLLMAESTPRAAGSVDDFLTAFLPMIPAINRFFDEVLVMTEAEDLRRNRLGMLQRIASLAEGVADMSRLEGF